MQRASEQQKELLTIKEVAVLCGCSDRHIDRQVELGRFPAPLRLGASKRWSRVSILRWIQSQTEGKSDG